MTNNTNDTIKIDPRTPEGRKALRLMVVPPQGTDSYSGSACQGKPPVLL